MTANGLRATNPRPLRARDGSPGKRNLPLVLAVVLLCCVAVGIAALPWLRRERQMLIRLQHHIERAAAPDEPVLVDDRWLGWAVRWAGSRGSMPGVDVVRADRGPNKALPSREVVLVARPDDALVHSLRAAGYRLTPDASATTWDETGDGSGLCGHAAVRIYFVLPPEPPNGPAGIPSMP